MNFALKTTMTKLRHAGIKDQGYDDNPIMILIKDWNKCVIKIEVRTEVLMCPRMLMRTRISIRMSCGP